MRAGIRGRGGVYVVMDSGERLRWIPNFFSSFFFFPRFSHVEMMMKIRFGFLYKVKYILFYSCGTNIC